MRRPSPPRDGAAGQVTSDPAPPGRGKAVILACYLTAAGASTEHVDPNATWTSRTHPFPASVFQGGWLRRPRIR